MSKWISVHWFSSASLWDYRIMGGRKIISLGRLSIVIKMPKSAMMKFYGFVLSGG